ncbi:hypothetical protein SAMN05518672_103201 [Chitinophaga sp. CF118]|uniref:hypothetical protein n=1 Tax=Chitinophaga sp. CF118 TaxID=1884367 RepID=UPI0008E1EBD7|nr:hypothetical protein [Chitinophaga sp. CF118]SFD78348.1 hypothetical protein SAMN05518672_103201 [Chitinophaga sp. CF118]
MIKTFYSACLLFAILVGTSSNSQAQLKRFSIGPYVEAGVPTGDLSDTHNTGFGAGLNADIKLIAGFGVTGSVGYMRFPGKDVVTTDPILGTTMTTSYSALQAIPVRVGVKYKFPFPLLYLKVEGGVAKSVGSGENEAPIIFAPGIGIRFLGLDVEAKYEGWYKDGTAGFFGLKAGYNF